jgi:hypothetical protein
VCDDGVKTLSPEQMFKVAASTTHRQGISQFDRAQIMNRGTCFNQLISETTAEAERKLKRQTWTQVLVVRLR